MIEWRVSLEIPRLSGYQSFLDRSSIKCITNQMEVSLGFGTRVCDYCGREFEAVRQIQHLCGRECHDRYFHEERKQALALWRAQQRCANIFSPGTQPLRSD